MRTQQRLVARYIKNVKPVHGEFVIYTGNQSVRYIGQVSNCHCHPGYSPQWLANFLPVPREIFGENYKAAEQKGRPQPEVRF